MDFLKNLSEIINKKNRFLYLLVALTGVAASLTGLYSPVYIKDFIDTTLSAREILPARLWRAAGVIAIIFAAQSSFIFVRDFLAALASESSIKQLKDRLYDHVQRLPFDYLSRAKTGDLIQRCTSDVDTVRKFISQRVTELIRIICLIIFSFMFMLRTNVKLAFIGTFSIPPILAASFIFAKRFEKKFLAADEKEGVLTSILQENLNNARVVRAFGREAYENKKFDGVSMEFRVLIQGLINSLAAYWLVTEAIGQAQVFATIITSAAMGYRGEITIGTCVLFLSYEVMLIFPVRQIGRILVDLGKMRVSVGRIFEILNAPAETETPGADVYSLKGDIEFKNVSFKFSDSDEHMLRNINFSVKSGQTIGILGPTGAGKSTLTHILLRLYDYEGSIKINGTELRNIKKDCARKKIGLTLQDSFLFSKTINENIKMANIKSSDMDVRKVARSAKIHDVIETFERGYETVVGERGVTLSGGQKQRVAIARTLIKNSDILIFDDSLSAVDAETDAEIRAELKLRASDVTTFLISQRVTTLKEADRIMTLEKGEITSEGTHEELISRDGLYKKIWDIQSALEAELTGD